MGTCWKQALKTCEARHDGTAKRNRQTNLHELETPAPPSIPVMDKCRGQQFSETIVK